MKKNQRSGERPESRMAASPDGGERASTLAHTLAYTRVHGNKRGDGEDAHVEQKHVRTRAT